MIVARERRHRIRTSVIIPALCAPSTLPAVLDALERQIGPQREAILVQSALAGEGPGPVVRWPWLRVLSVPERLWPGQARNLGAAHARGELLAFLDADTVPSPDWLDHLEAALTNGVDAVAGAITNGTPRSRIGTAEYLLTCSETLPSRPRAMRHSPGGNLLVRHAYFEAVGGFSAEVRAGEDSIFTFPLARMRRLGFAARATVAHSNRTELGPFLANQRVQGAAFVAICSRVPYPHRWVSRGPGLLIAGPLRLLALLFVLLHNPGELTQGIRSLPPLVCGTAAWVRGAFEARRWRYRSGR